MWAKPFAPPPDNTNPTFGFLPNCGKEWVDPKNNIEIRRYNLVFTIRLKKGLMNIVKIIVILFDN